MKNNMLIKAKVKTKNKKSYKIIVIFFIIAILIELLVLNNTSIRVLFCKNKNLEVPFKAEQNTVFVEEQLKEITSNPSYESYELTAILNNINTDIYNISVHTNSSNGLKCKIEIKKDDKSTYKIEDVSYRYDIIRNENININTYMAKEQIKNNIGVVLQTYEKRINISKIVLNEFHLRFNFLRVICVFLLILLIYYITSKKIYKIDYNKSSKKQKYIFYTIMSIVITMLTVLYSLEFFCYPQKNKVDPYDERTKESMVLQAEAFRNGSIPLLVEPNQYFYEMENPYDISERFWYDAKYVFDTAYYNGKFYQYFSVLPVIFFVLPFRLIFGFYITTKFFNLILFDILLILISILYKKCIDKFIKKVSLFNMILGYITLIFGSNIINYARGLMYDIPVVFGLISLISTILIFINLLENKKYIIVKLIIAGIFTGFIVMSKPSLIGYYIIVFYMLYTYIRKSYKSKKDTIIKIVSFFIPLIILGIIQMWYNKVRFDSIFEFGALYQLTVADMKTHTGISLPILLKGLSKFLFYPPCISLLKFPFINTYNEMYYNMGLNEYEYENSVAGIFTIPILWLIFLKNKINSTSKEEKTLKRYINIVIITAITLLIIITCFAGAAEAYSIDIKIMMVFTCILIGLKIIEQKEKLGKTKEASNFTKLYLMLCIISIILVAPQSISTEASLLEKMYMPVNIYISHFFEFWT